MTKNVVRGLAIIGTLAPFVLLVLGAFSDDSAISRLAFNEVRIENLGDNLTQVIDRGFSTAVFNTLWICLPMVFVQLGSAALAAYAFANFEFKHKKLFFTLIVGSYLIPSIATFLPLYFLMNSIGLKGSLGGILLPFVLFSPYAVVMLRERFEAIPREIIDQSRIDGLTEWGILTRVAIPMIRSFIALLALITFVSTWNAYLWPRLVAGSEWPTVTVAVANLQSQFDSHWNLVLSATLLAIIPAMSAFILARKNMIRSPLAELEI